jgi:hypothetical protein
MERGRHGGYGIPARVDDFDEIEVKVSRIEDAVDRRCRRGRCRDLMR